MLRSALIVDAHDYTDSGEGLLVEHLARRTGLFRRVVRLPFFPKSTTRWSLVWYTGHLALYKKTGERHLETLAGGVFYPINKDLSSLKADLLVLATCNSHGIAAPEAGTLVTHAGNLDSNIALIFAASFAADITTRPAMKYDDVWCCFSTAKRLSSHGWRITRNATTRTKSQARS